jgi:flagellar biosynthesis protein FlhF
MRIRIFRARTLAEAMAQIRTELGADALILSDRSRDGFVEVTAALETNDTPGLRAPVPPRVEARVAPRTPPDTGLDDLEPFSVPPARAPSPPRNEAAPPVPRVAGPDGGGHAILAWHGLSPPLIAALGSGPIEQSCARTFRFASLPVAPKDRPLLLAGPPGGGKTLTVARLATRLVLAGEQPMVITADGKRAGAVEQLAAFTRLLGLTLLAANTPAMLARSLERRTVDQPVLIDAPGLDLQDPTQSELLQALLAASDATMALVLPCGLDPGEAQEIACAHAALGAQSMVATRTDLSRRMGGILCAASAAGLALTEAGIGSAAADSLVPLTPGFLAERLRRGAIQPARQAAPHATGLAPTLVPVELRAREPERAPDPVPDRVIVRSALPLHIAAQRRAASTP